MAIQNPDYKYYKQLAGTWKNADGTCIVTLTETIGINMEYGGAVLNGNYGVIPTGPLMELYPQGVMEMGMMNTLRSSDDMVARRDPSEDIQLKLGDRSLKNGDRILYNIDFIWHDLSDRLHVELSNTATGEKSGLMLYRETAPARTDRIKDGEVQCECGQIFSGKFCPNCGKMRIETNTFTCSCGYTGPVSNFCPECGRPRPGFNPSIGATPAAVTPSTAFGPLYKDTAVPEKEPEPTAGWTCTECGAKLQTSVICSKCGAMIKTELLFAISEYTTCCPPRNDSVRVWKFSDTQLIMQHGKTLRFIPATVIEPAMEIIRKYEIDKWEEYKNSLNGVMGGSRSVSYWDGEKMAGTSTDHMPGASGAYSSLYALFTTACNS